MADPTPMAGAGAPHPAPRNGLGRPRCAPGAGGAPGDPAATVVALVLTVGGLVLTLLCWVTFPMSRTVGLTVGLTVDNFETLFS